MKSAVIKFDLPEFNDVLKDNKKFICGQLDSGPLVYCKVEKENGIFSLFSSGTKNTYTIQSKDIDSCINNKETILYKNQSSSNLFDNTQISPSMMVLDDDIYLWVELSDNEPLRGF